MSVLAQLKVAVKILSSSKSDQMIALQEKEDLPCELFELYYAATESMKHIGLNAELTSEQNELLRRIDEIFSRHVSIEKTGANVATSEFSESNFWEIEGLDHHEDWRKLAGLFKELSKSLPIDDFDVHGYTRIVPM